MIKKNEILSILDENKEGIKKFGVKRIGIFGSFVKNKAKTKSDVDILIEFQQGQKSFDNYMELKDFLEKKLQRKVDLVVKEALKSRIKSLILKETLYAGL